MASDQIGRAQLEPVIFEPMPQQPRLLGTKEDWTGITSSTERRKLQNRINQRAYNASIPERIISEFEKWVERHRMIGSPRTDHLLVLIKFNVFRALISNARDIGISDKESMDDDSLSPYSSNPCSPSTFIRTTPASLHPTQLQRQICHHPWIDTLPIPGMRDNLLLASDSYDELQICADLLGIYNESADRSGMIVSGDPWDPAGWEVTESFAKQWGWTIRGCEQLFLSTNHWRTRRGEKPLRFERLLCEGARQPEGREREKTE
ncbi:hypothetical protein OIDMADRAFT_170938 [Oidiodendron maius Zn]|uniref:BZIP domain-containing protein n=1 Tax=Oidiodendron maius (strain Zn) TaxID=913774 RepID=A0A0C3H146_OIDMZ|nr:hypothetical protein OIDMADRAFT_170938 [Oidiodendron maius Zn]